MQHLWFGRVGEFQAVPSFIFISAYESMLQWEGSRPAGDGTANLGFDSSGGINNSTGTFREAIEILPNGTKAKANWS